MASNSYCWFLEFHAPYMVSLFFKWELFVLFLVAIIFILYALLYATVHYTDLLLICYLLDSYMHVAAL